MDDYEKLEKIGKGAYGTVYKARCWSSGEVVALKKVKLQDSEEGVPHNTIREISLLQELCHPCVVALRDIRYANMDVLYMIFEYMEQDLKMYLDSMLLSQTLLEGWRVKSYLYQLLCAVSFCHTHRVLHRDLKPQNILIDQKGNLKLADFGLARVYTVAVRQYTHEVVTLWYRPPEILLGSDHYTTSADIWSIGCILAEMSTLRAFFPGTSEIDQLFKIFRILGTPTECDWPGWTSLEHYSHYFPRFCAQSLERRVPTLEASALEVMKKMLALNPAKRITCRAAAHSAYFADLDPGTKARIPPP